MRKLLILGVLALAGCGGGTATASPAPSAHDRWESCDRAMTGNAAPTRLDDTFPATAAIVCPHRTFYNRPTPSVQPAGPGLRATAITDLVAALRLPDEPPTKGACTMVMIDPPWIALLDAQDRWIHPGVPVDACGHPRAEVLTAVGKLLPG
ncbi:hypothetical protein [Actinoplanes sp. HUAS TT8]|uniref:hypothetical protein n=1 Tax=Actinoplanes sp. HUAS TT8 TaxID=3447453 RepID=UPI003F5268A1